MSSLHIIPFALRNPLALSFDSNGPIPTLYRTITLRVPSVETLNLSQYAGRTILITGTTSGCGLECARAFARVDCRLVLTTRSRERGEEVVRQFQDESKGASSRAVIDLVELDMTSPQSVQLLPSRLKSLGVTQLDIAILNAGTYQTSLRVCPETRWEEVIQHTIRDLLNQFNKPESEPYPPYQRYHISKLLLMLWIRHLSARDEWAQVSIAAVSPGFTSTGLWRDFNSFSIAKVIEYLCCRSCEKGAGQYVCALDDLVRGHGHGGFWSDAGWRAPSAIVSSKLGQELQDGIYTHVVGILKTLGMIDNGNA